MSNFLHKGVRQQIIKKKKEAKTHLKKVYKILDELNVVALEIIKNEKLDTITKDNIAEIASKYTKLELAEFETNVLLSKLKDYKNRVIPNETN